MNSGLFTGRPTGNGVRPLLQNILLQQMWVIGLKPLSYLYRQTVLHREYSTSKRHEINKTTNDINYHNDYCLLGWSLSMHNALDVALRGCSLSQAVLSIAENLSDLFAGSLATLKENLFPLMQV